jgi:hypothetical protein
MQTRCNVHCTDALCSDGAAPLLNPPLPSLRYFIHGHGAFNFSDVLSALHARTAGQRMDVALPVGEAQYLSDIPIMAALERHPLRTFDANAAELHVIGALPFASYVLALVSGGEEAHGRRMGALAAELAELTLFVERERPFLLLHCSCSAKELGVPLMNTLGRGNLIVASCDPFFARDFGKLPQSFAHAYRRGVTIPFYPHSLAYDDGGQTKRQAPRQTFILGDGIGDGRALHSARSGLMFHGGLGRYDHGLRDAMLLLLERVRLNGSVPVDTRAGEMTRGSNRSAYSRDSYARTARSYRAASMCMVPSGDVPSSRRLFDVMSAVCVPVLVRSYYRMTSDRHSFTTSLPFPLSIDWRATSLWLGPIVRGKNREACMEETKNWLLRWHAEGAEALETTRRNARAVFGAYLDSDRNPEGIVWGLLREIEHRSKNCDLTMTRPKSPYLKNNTVDDPTLCPYNDAASVRRHPGFSDRPASKRIYVAPGTGSRW